MSQSTYNVNKQRRLVDLNGDSKNFDLTFTCTSKDGAVYVARFNNSPGKVTLKNGSIHEFYVLNIGCSFEGEILLTNRLWEWKKIDRGCTIPENAVKNGFNSWNYDCYIGKALCGEPGWLFAQPNKKMWDINCSSEKVLHKGYILVYSEDI